MDDLQLLEIPGGIWHRTKEIFQMYLAFGECKWTHAFFCAVLYKVFAHAPRAFYIFKWFEILAMVLVWGFAARQLTGRKLTFWLLPSIAMSFAYLYDQFFFLSTHETTGLLFFGLALIGINQVLFQDRRGFVPWVLVCLLLALGSKETFIAAGFALGLAVACRPKWRAAGVVLSAVMVLYGFGLKKFVSSAYTAHYSLLNLNGLKENLKAWVTKDFSNHMPWVLVWAFLWFSSKKGPSYTLAEKWGILLGALLYAGFLLVLLPWNTKSYYAAPLGICFAWTSALVLSPLLEKASRGWNMALISASLALNLFVSGYTLHREAAYHRNTQDLWQWIKQTSDFQQAAKRRQVDCDGMEAAYAIPGHANRQWGLKLPGFQYVTDIHQAAKDGMKYFVHSPRFGSHSVDAAGWQVVFDSPWWKVYQK